RAGRRPAVGCRCRLKARRSRLALLLPDLADQAQYALDGARRVAQPGRDLRRLGLEYGRWLRAAEGPFTAVIEELGFPHSFPPPFGEELLDQADRLALQKDFRRRWDRLPNLHGPVLAGAGQALAVGAPAHPRDYFGVGLQGEEFLAGCRLPNLH